MATSIDELVKLLDRSRRRLDEAQRCLNDAATTLGLVEHELPNLELGKAARPSPGALSAAERADLIESVLAALDPAARVTARGLLNLDPEEETFRIGRRRLALSDSEQTILRLLWDSVDRPVSRRAMASALYGEAATPHKRSVDVFLTNLRRKLRTAGDGSEPIQTIRRRGWALVPELCIGRAENRAHENRNPSSDCKAAR